jgi:hypothetical protein
MRRGRPMTVSMTVSVTVPMIVSVAVGVRHGKMLYYNITSVYGRPMAMAIAAARNGNGSDTAARNQTNRAGMNGISHKMTR